MYQTLYLHSPIVIVEGGHEVIFRQDLQPFQHVGRVSYTGHPGPRRNLQRLLQVLAKK